MAEISVSEYTDDRRESLIEMILKIQRQEFQILITREDQPDLAAIPRFYQQGNGNFWVAECDGLPVGFAAVWTADNFLHHLFVDPDWQGKHIGSALLAQVERTFTASGTLKCLMENKNALRFYQRHGWTIEAQGASPEGRYWLMRSPRP